MLPVGMPDSVEDVVVQTKKDGSFGYILFTPEYSFAEPMKKMDLQVEIEYQEGFMIVGMGEAYTIRMLTNEFWELTQQTWEFAPIGVSRRENDGTVVHGVEWDRVKHRAIMNEDEKVVPPPKILEERGRGTVIKNQANQGKLLKYWAWAQTPIEVGVYFPEESITIEYWMNIILPKVENEEDPTIYLLALKELWIIRLRQISNGVAQCLESIGNDFGVQMRYLYNSLRVWFVPLVSFQAGVRRPLAEEPIPKDKWYSPSDLMAFTSPVAQVREEPSIIFGPGSFLQELYPDPEVQGGKIVLIAFKHLRAQKPPNGLDRLQSTFQKQVAYNQRIMEAEIGIAGINCDVPNFLYDMSFAPEDQLIVCINGSEGMKRDEEAIAGQLWIQGDRKMTASNRVLQGMANARDSAILSAAAEAVNWRHAGEPAGPRKGQRVIVFPKELPQLEAVLSSNDPSVYPVDGHSIAYEAILQGRQQFENPPVFLKEDSEPVLSDPIMADKVQAWMAISKHVAVGNRRRVLETVPTLLGLGTDAARSRSFLPRN
jgi:hypothetical protein